MPATAKIVRYSGIVRSANFVKTEELKTQATVCESLTLMRSQELCGPENSKKKLIFPFGRNCV